MNVIGKKLTTGAVAPGVALATAATPTAPLTTPAAPPGRGRAEGLPPSAAGRQPTCGALRSWR